MNGYDKLSFKKLLFFTFIFVCIFLLTNPMVQLQAKSQKNIRIKPDIQIHKFAINKVRINPDKSHNVKLKVTVKNVSMGKTCTGPFKILVEWRTSPKVPYRRLSQANVSDLCSNPTGIKLETATRVFNHIVPSGETYHYRVTVDSNSNVSEVNESNNKKTDKYFALPVLTLIDNNLVSGGTIADRIPSCDGIDLIVKGVEIIRNSSGAVFIKATIKNLCEGSCTGPIVIEVDESDVLGRPGGIEQQISNGIGSKGEFTMFSALGIANISTRRCSYIVKVKSEGGCTEPVTKRGNNSYRITVDPL